MTRWRTSPISRLHMRPTATKYAKRPVEGEAVRGAAGAASVVFVGNRLTQRSAGFLHQVGLDERVDVAVEDAAHIADLLLRPVILHELIGVQDVAANLAAEGNLLLRATDLLQFGLILLHLQVVEPRFQHL